MIADIDDWADDIAALRDDWPAVFADDTDQQLADALSIEDLEDRIEDLQTRLIVCTATLAALQT